MKLLPYSDYYAKQIADLLNKYLPFEPETEETVRTAVGVRFITVNEADEVVGYIAGQAIDQFDTFFPYFKEQLSPLQEIIKDGDSIYSSHFVVHPQYRKLGLGQKLVNAYTEQATKQFKHIVVVGWVQSDRQAWAAEKQFVALQYEPLIYIQNYFKPYNVYCPSCNTTCYCDASIFIKSKDDIGK